MHTILTNHSGAEYSYYDAFTEGLKQLTAKEKIVGSSSSRGSSSSSSGGGARFNIEDLASFRRTSAEEATC